MQYTSQICACHQVRVSLQRRGHANLYRTLAQRTLCTPLKPLGLTFEVYRARALLTRCPIFKHPFREKVPFFQRIDPRPSIHFSLCFFQQILQNAALLIDAFGVVFRAKQLSVR